MLIRFLTLSTFRYKFSVLGSKVEIEKRRRLSQCLNGADYQRKSFEHRPCECSEDDVMCDFGYKQTGEIETKNCTKIDQSSLPSCPVSATQFVLSSMTISSCVESIDSLGSR